MSSSSDCSVFSRPPLFLQHRTERFDTPHFTAARSSMLRRAQQGLAGRLLASAIASMTLPPCNYLCNSGTIGNEDLWSNHNKHDSNAAFLTGSC